MLTRNRTPSKYIGYGLYLYFSGLSLKKASERLSQIYKRNHVFFAKSGIGFKSTSLKS
ncbi:hypothetical protein [Candidatus Nitrosocosmicus sp. SS]|uniref:hypothetical protein n=1 Tax=Candidatus Nitrosocosmicus agrestis TaxID=2563600 RepID=UPI0012B6065D|nr:hypothetical protein [Candidatus Nitrosocosmicus sp. SS]